MPTSNTTNALKMSFVATLGAMLVVLSAGTAKAADEGRPAFPTQGAKEFAEDQIIVKLEEGATQADLTALNERNDARTEEDLPRSDVNVVDLPSHLTVGEAVQRYEASPNVEHAEPDYLLQPAASPNDPYLSRLYALNNNGQTGGMSDADVDANEAWSTTTGSPSTVVAIIDEGVDTSHPDLRGNIWVNTDEIPGNRIDDDRNGYVDDVNGYDFAHNDASVYDAADGDDHGTHVTGTIAAQGNNGIGVTGVNWRASIMVLKFMGSNGGYTSDAIEALNYAVANGAKISNNSWSGGSSSILQSTIGRADSAGHLFVAAAGNNGTNNDTTPSYPASYTNANIISVAATDDRDTLASFSNFGASSVDLAAPGVNIVSTLPGNRYGSYSGTSMATPHVTGVAALIKSQNPTLSDDQLKARILQFAEPKNTLQGKVATGGRLNAYASLAQRAVAPDSTGPTVTSVKPSPRTRDRTPTITATIRDDRDKLSANNINLALDGRARATISYEASTGRLIYNSGRLSVGRHKARITAADTTGNATIRTWTFKVVLP